MQLLLEDSPHVFLQGQVVAVSKTEDPVEGFKEGGRGGGGGRERREGQP